MTVDANGRNARFWADQFAEIEKANRDALGAHHKPGHSVAELITAVVGELDREKKCYATAYDGREHAWGELERISKLMGVEDDDFAVEAVAGEVERYVDQVKLVTERLTRERDEARRMRDLLAEEADELREAGHRVAGMFNSDPENHQIPGVLHNIVGQLIAWRTDSTQVPDGWRSLVRKGWSVGARLAIPADAADLAWSACMDDDKFTGLASDQILEVIRRTLKAIAPVPVSGSDTTADGAQLLDPRTWKPIGDH